MRCEPPSATGQLPAWAEAGSTRSKSPSARGQRQEGVRAQPANNARASSPANHFRLSQFAGARAGTPEAGKRHGMRGSCSSGAEYRCIPLLGVRLMWRRHGVASPGARAVRDVADDSRSTTVSGWARPRRGATSSPCAARSSDCITGEPAPKRMAEQTSHEAGQRQLGAASHRRSCPRPRAPFDRPAWASVIAATGHWARSHHDRRRFYCSPASTAATVRVVLRQLPATDVCAVGQAGKVGRAGVEQIVHRRRGMGRA